jgi:long-chain fatty acid transport protein
MTTPFHHHARRAGPTLWVAGAAALVATAAPAQASPLFELVGGVHGTAGFNARVTGAGAAATYFNPALLAHAGDTVELGVFMLSDQIGIALDARASSPHCQDGACDVPSVFGGGPESFRHADGSPIDGPALPTEWLENGRAPSDGDGGFRARPRQGAGTGQNVRAYQVLGLVSPVFDDRLVLGLYAMIPLSEFTTAHAFYNDEREQYFSNSLHPELYSDRMTATSLAFGVGGRVTDRLSAGLTFTLSLRNRATAPVYVSNLADLDTVLLDSEIGVQAAVAPHVGLAYDVAPRLRLAATVHSEQAFEIETGFNYLLATGSEQSATVTFTHAWMPWSVAGGAVYELAPRGPDQVALAATAVLARWSRYKDRHSERPHPDYAWADTLSGSAGIRHRRGALRSFVDVGYQPSPVPAQTGRTNYVDNDRLGLAGGGDLELARWGGRVRVGLQVQGHRLLRRHVTKFVPPPNPQPNPNEPGFGDGHYPQLVIDEVPDDAVDGVLGEPIPGREGLQTNNPGFPGFASDGWVWGAGLQLTIVR